MWDGNAVPLRLTYSFAQKVWIDDSNSFLNVSLNGEFLKRLPVSKDGIFAPVMNMLGLTLRQQSAVVNIDPRAILGSNQLGFWFGIKPQKNAPVMRWAMTTFRAALMATQRWISPIRGTLGSCQI